MSSSVLGLCPLDAVASLTPSFGGHKCLQILPGVPWGQNHSWLRAAGPAVSLDQASPAPAPPALRLRLLSPRCRDFGTETPASAQAQADWGGCSLPAPPPHPQERHPHHARIRARCYPAPTSPAFPVSPILLSTLFIPQHLHLLAYYFIECIVYYLSLLLPTVHRPHKSYFRAGIFAYSTDVSQVPITVSGPWEMLNKHCCMKHQDPTNIMSICDLCHHSAVGCFLFPSMLPVGA